MKLYNVLTNFVLLARYHRMTKERKIFADKQMINLSLRFNLFRQNYQVIQVWKETALHLKQDNRSKSKGKWLFMASGVDMKLPRFFEKYIRGVQFSSVFLGVFWLKFYEVLSAVIWENKVFLPNKLHACACLLTLFIFLTQGTWNCATIHGGLIACSKQKYGFVLKLNITKIVLNENAH